jgi:ribonucleoside-diphosphate reductase alpha chain
VRQDGKRFIAAEAHIYMMAAVQPFISGAISKTINMPNESTVEEVKQAYMEGWRWPQGQRALPRRLEAQPAAQRRPATTSAWTSWATRRPRRARRAAGPAEVAERIMVATSPERSHRLPKKRRAGYTQKAVIGGHKVFLRTGEYEDGNSARSSSTCTRRAPPSAR